MTGPSQSDEIARLEQEVLDAKKRLTDALRKQPPQPVSEYTLRYAGSGAPVRLTDLFGSSSDLLVVHNMGKKCVYCTLWADGFSNVYKHIANRCPFVLTTPDDPTVAGAFAGSRGWTFPVLSHAGTTFAADLGFNPAEGDFHPGVSALFKESSGKVVRTGSRPFGPGDDFCSVWPLLDLLKNGSAEWAPKYHY